MGTIHAFSFRMALLLIHGQWLRLLIRIVHSEEGAGFQGIIEELYS
jgi:hypothetical protein